MAELNEKQKEVCRRVARGESGTKAYADVFGCSQGSAAASACRLLKRDNAREFINSLTAAARELSRAADARAVGDKAERMRMLWTMAKDSQDAGDVQSSVKCIAELNKMDGSYEPERIRTEVVSFSFEAIMEGLVRPGGGV